MDCYYNQNGSEQDKTQIVKILIPVSPYNERLIKYSAVYKSEFPLFPRLKLVKG